MSSLPGFFSTPGAAIAGALWPGDTLTSSSPPVFTFPAYWSVAWAQAETQVTVEGIVATLTIAPAGPLAATVTVMSAGQVCATLQPPDTEVLYPQPATVIAPS